MDLTKQRFQAEHPLNATQPKVAFARKIDQMKKIIATTALTLLSAVANASNLYEIKATQKANNGWFSDAGFSFVTMSSDPQVHGGNVEFSFLTYDRGDILRTGTMASDYNQIYDLGKKSCKDVSSQYPDERNTRPLVWLAYSEASEQMDKVERHDFLPVNQGHCYLVYTSDAYGRVVALFNVKYYNPGVSIVIDEAEVLDNLRVKN